RDEAIRLVRLLRPGQLDNRDLTFEVRSSKFEVNKRSVLALAVSGSLHITFLIALLFVASLGWFHANETEQSIKEAIPVHLVFLMAAGPGGGGGGGGLKLPDPPSRAERIA